MATQNSVFFFLFVTGQLLGHRVESDCTFITGSFNVIVGHANVEMCKFTKVKVCGKNWSKIGINVFIIEFFQTPHFNR